MEQHGIALAPLAALEDLRPLAGERWSFLSVHLSLGPASEETAKETALRWRDARLHVASEGAPDAVLAAVDEALDGAWRRGSGLSVVAPAGGAAAHVVHLPVPPPFELVWWGLVPALVPLIAVRQRWQPHVVALVDRTGADLAVRGVGEGRPRTVEVEGDDSPVRKSGPGGWSQRRYQQRAEDSWHHNMSEVAEELAGLAARSGARVVALGGDERAVDLVTEMLPAGTRELVRRVAATRAADGSAEHLDSEVGGVLDEWVEAQLSETLARYRQERGQRDRATAGAAATLEELRSSRVGVLLIRLGLASGGDDRRAWIGPAPELVAADPAELSGLGGFGDEEIRPAPLADAAVTAALATGADVRVVPDDAEVPEGIGALLRW